MAISDYKITAEDIAKYGCVNLPDRLTGDAQENKMKFDRLVRECVAGAVNAVIDHMQLVENESIEWSEAEQDRVTAEAARQAAEELRDAAEEARQDAEQAREQAEALRASAETARALAEAARDGAEDARRQAETAREAAEAGREEAEAGREAAEQEREREREAFAVFEDYNPAKEYVPGNKVYFEGSSYINRVSCTGISPTDAAHWQMIARRGASGDGTGDMLKSEYDPQNRNADIWAVRQVKDGGTGAGTVQGALRNLHAKPGESLLVNGYFVNPVNRKGKTEYTETGVCIDGWRTVDGWKVKILPGVGIETNLLYQHLESEALLDGKTLTFSVLTAGHQLLTGTGVFHHNTAVPVWFYNDGNITLLYNEVFKGFEFCALDKTLVTLIAARLELGDTQTLAYQDEDGVWQLLDTPDYDEEYLKCCLYSLADGAFVGLPYSNENLLDNWYFVDPVNQRGQTEYAGYTYAIDRWVLSGEGRIVISDSGIKFTSGPSLSMFGQKVESVPLRGKTATFSVLVKELTGFLFISFGTLNIPVSNGVTLITAYVPDDAGIVYPYIWGDNPSSSCVLRAAKLEPGSVQTLAHQDADGNWILNDPPPDKALELLKCQRYFINMNPLHILPIYGTGIAENTQWAWIPVSIPTTMRIMPSVIFSNVVIENCAGSPMQATDMELTQSGAGAVQLKVYGSGLAQGSPYMIHSGELCFDANL